MIKVLIQIDPIDKLNKSGDTSIHLAWQAQLYGYQIWTSQIEGLSCKEDNEIYVKTKQWKLNDQYSQSYELSETKTIPIKEFDVVLIRNDPPINMKYIANLQLMNLASQKTLFINSPKSIIELTEKIPITLFPQYIPPTIISSDLNDIKDFLLTHQKIVIKPLYCHSGESISYIEAANIQNLAPIYNLYKKNYDSPLMLQKYLDLNTAPDKRVITIDGEITQSFQRVAMSNDFRANLACGGKAVPIKLTEEEHKLCTEVAVYLKSKGIFFAGLDLIGDKLIEINLTSPTGLRAIQDLYGINLAKTFWDKLQKYITQ